VAIGRLVQRAQVRKAAERANFEKRFTRFEKREIHAHFRRLFGSSKSAAKQGAARPGQRAAGSESGVEKETTAPEASQQQGESQ
jgi:hypothetical protein